MPRKSLRGPEPAFALSLVESRPQTAPEADIVSEAIISENPTVFDIGIAREAQRMRHRQLFRPVVISRRRANLVRFGEPGVTVMPSRGTARRNHWAPSNDCDLPPAA